MFQSIQPAHTTVSTSLHTLSKKWECSHAHTIKTRQWSFTWKGEGERIHLVWTGENGKKKCSFLTPTAQNWCSRCKGSPPFGRPEQISPCINTLKQHHQDQKHPRFNSKSHNNVAELPLSHHTHLPKASLGCQRGFDTSQNRNWFNLSKVNILKREAKAGWSPGLWKKNIHVRININYFHIINNLNCNHH